MLLDTDDVGVTIIAVVINTMHESLRIENRKNNICAIKQMFDITSEYGIHN